MSQITVVLVAVSIALASCTSSTAKGGSDADAADASMSADSASPSQDNATNEKMIFNADSAYSYVARQVEFGPRVPNTEAHRLTSAWLASELRRHGAEVTVQNADIEAWDGTILKASNIIGQYNPDAEERTVLVAHWDCRPYADKDADSKNHSRTVDGANDGASGVGVLLELARLMGQKNPDKGIDILFVDAEDWGDYDNEESWALGARWFVNRPFKPGYRPAQAIVLDMVGAPGATFYREYFSEMYHPRLVQQIWDIARNAGYGSYFMNSRGGAVTDDHLEFIKAGIPAIDIIDFDPDTGFTDTWHTIDDTMANISAESLKAVGQTMADFIYSNSK